MSATDNQSSGQVSTDAMPLPPRQQLNPDQSIQTQMSQQLSQEQSIPAEEPTLDFPEPHPDWKFNNFLDEMAESLSGEELEKIKYLFAGEGGIGQGVLQKVNSALELFRILRNRRYLTRDNVLYLQAMLRRVGRIDLVKKAIAFARTMGNTLHFYQATEEPENGYEYVRFHIEGTDYRNYTRLRLMKLRSTVAEILFIPPEFVLIAGVEASLSMLITLMIPSEFVSILNAMLKKGNELPELQELGVDIVQIDEDVMHKVKGPTDDRDIETEQQAKLVTVYQQLNNKTKALENTELDNIDLRRELEKLKIDEKNLKSRLLEASQKAKMLAAIMKQSPEEVMDDGTKRAMGEGWLKEFNEALMFTDKKGYDKKMIQQLLEYNTTIVAVGSGQKWRNREKQLIGEIQALQNMVVPMQLELTKYQYFNTVKSSDIDKILAERFRNLFSSIPVQPEVLVQLTEGGLAVLRKISKGLRPRDKQKLEKLYQWQPDDPVKKYMDQDISLFLAGIFYKQVEQTQTQPDFDTFVCESLDKVGRDDLKTKFLQEMQRARHTKDGGKSHQQQPMTSTQHVQQPNFGQQFGPVPRPPSASTPGAGQEDIQSRNTIAKMAQQMQVVYDTMQSTRASYDQHHDPWKLPGFATEFGSTVFKGRQASTDRSESPRPRNQSGD